MKNFDTDNLVNPELIQSALLYVDDKLHFVVDMDLEDIVVQDTSGRRTHINDNDWRPAYLTDLWLDILLGTSRKIKNSHTTDYWVIRKCGHYFYLTIDRDISLGECLVLPINYVHDLQEWYYRLTGNNLIYDLPILSTDLQLI